MQLELFFGIPLQKELLTLWLSCETKKKELFLNSDSTLLEKEWKNVLYFGKILEDTSSLPSLEIVELHLKSILRQILLNNNAEIQPAKLFAYY